LKVRILAESHTHHAHEQGTKGDHHHRAGVPHRPGATGNRRRLAWAAALTGLFLLVEIVGGLISGSLALLADAGHMFTDLAALLLAWFAMRIAARPADWKWTYGFDRVSILAAFVNGLALFVIAGMIVFEAVERLLAPQEVAGGLMLSVAVAGLAVNLVAFALLHGGTANNLNMRGAALHVMGDLLGSVAAIVGAGIIMATGWMPIDPILSVLVALLILRSAFMLVREAGHILLEGAPRGLDRRHLASALCKKVPGLTGIHHVHIWSLSEERRMATFHACIAEDAEAAEVLAGIRDRLDTDFGIDHVTVEIECGSGRTCEACADCA